MQNAFSCELYAPSQSKMVRFNELTIKYLKTIVKYIQNEDDAGLCCYFNKILNDLGPDKYESGYDRLDKFCILLGIRIISIGPSIDLQFTCESTNKEFTYRMDLFKILQKIADLEDLYKNNTLKINDNTSIILGFPSKLVYDNYDTIAFECISSVIINNKVYDIKSLGSKEKDEIFALLPGTISSDIIKYITQKQKILNDLVFIDVKSPFDPDKEVISMNFDGLNNALMEFVKTLFRMNIDEIYNLIYILTTKLSFTAEYIENNLTFAECMVYINKLKHELAEKEKAMKKQGEQSMMSSNSPGMPMPVQAPYTGIE